MRAGEWADRLLTNPDYQLHEAWIEGQIANKTTEMLAGTDYARYRALVAEIDVLRSVIRKPHDISELAGKQLETEGAT